jgi:hypothetical protein
MVVTMRFSPDACITCGTKNRKIWISENYYPKVISDHEGTFINYPYWFCSEACLEQALETYIDKRFHYSSGLTKDPAFPDHHIEEFIEVYTDHQSDLYVKAIVTLSERAYGEYKAQRVAEIAKEHADTGKEQARLAAAKQKEQERLDKIERQRRIDERREQDRLERLERQAILDRQRAEQNRKRDEEREARARKDAEREAEKQAKIAEEEAQKRAEEEKWRVKPFKF